MLFDLLHHLGPGWLARRMLWSAERRLGLLEYRMPRQAWKDFGIAAEAAAEWRSRAPKLPLSRLHRSDLAAHLEAWALECGHSPRAESDAQARGLYRIFSHDLVDAGRPPRWSENVISGGCVDPQRHWSHCRDDSQEDIKGVWELSRFSWVFPLVRAWVLDGDDRHVERFWTTVEDWKKHNPPNRGPNWMCGQEASLRLIALTFGLQAFRHHPATTEARILLTSRIAHATAERIAGHLKYALSQKNNHGISEAIGLMTAGVFWPTLPSAPSWRRQGLQALRSQVAELVGDDGGFSQHSTNYHRLFLQLLVWAELICRAAGSSLPADVRQKATAATDFLAELLEDDGTVPRYGADDGANLFPLSGTGYQDFRPAVGAALILFKGERLPAGPWDETALLLLGPMAASSAPGVRPAPNHPQSGVGVLRHPRGTAFFRAPAEFKHRPAQADQLHVSFRWDGEWIAADPGTYSYNSPDGLGALASATYHNVVTVNGRDPMRRFSRFLWLPWTSCTPMPEANGLRAEHDGYPGYRANRRVLVRPGGFVVIDRLSGLFAQSGRFNLRWHGLKRTGLEQLSIVCSTPSEQKYYTGDSPVGRAWHASHYGSKQAAWCREVTTSGANVVFVTSLGCAVRLERESVFIDGEEIAL